jgi:diamine N-acetyltransferase
MTAPCILAVPSVTLGAVTDRDYELFSEWASSSSWVYAGGSRQYLNAGEFKSFVENGQGTFLMVRTRDGQAIGAVSWQTGQYPASFEIGTFIGDAGLWQSGFGMEAVIALFGHLFDTKHAHRIEFICGAFNKAAMQACCSGLVKIDGVLRDYYYIDGAYHDAVIASILRDEYYALLRPGQTVPKAEIDEAHHILGDYLTKNPIVLRKQ